MSTIKRNFTLWRLIAGLFVLLPKPGHATPEAIVPLDQAGSLTLGDMVSTVIAANPGLDEMRAAAAAATHRIAPAGALADATVSYTLAPATVPEFETASGRSRDPNQRFELSQSLPWPGKLALRADAARFEADAADANIESTRLMLVAESKARFAEWFYVHQALHVNASNLALVEEIRAVAEQRYALGLVGQQDVIQAEVRSAELQRQRLEMDRLAEQVAAQINALLHRTAGTPVPLPAALPPMLDLPAIEGLQQRAALRHPDLIGIGRELAANNTREQLADKDFFPDFEVFAAYDGLWDESDKRFTVGVGINVPIGQEKRRARRDEAAAMSQQLQFRLSDRHAQLLSQLRQAYAAATQAVRTERLYRATLLPRSRENLSAARAEYGAGGGAFLDVIVAETQILDAELGMVKAHADYVIAVADVERWSGGELPLETTTEPRS